MWLLLSTVIRLFSFQQSSLIFDKIIIIIIFCFKIILNISNDFCEATVLVLVIISSEFGFFYFFLV
jgi:hypothetical protein